MKRRITALLLASLTAVSAILSGCANKAATDSSLVFESEGKENESSTADVNKTDPNGEKPTDKGYGILREASINKIGSLNPLTYLQSYTSEHINRVQAKLYGYFPNADGTFTSLEGELAQSEPQKMDAEGKVWQIKLRDGLKWENDDILNADDVIYTWKMMLDPKLANVRASNFAKDFIEIVNAEKYFTAVQGIAWEDVGLKKIDDLTLEITTVSAQDKTEVMMHLSHPANAIIYDKKYEEFMNSDRTETLYGTSQDKYMSSGPFKIKSWINDAQIEYEKNPNYALKDKVWLEGIITKVVGDQGTQMQLFENDEIDYVNLSSENYLKYEEDPRILLAPINRVNHIVINTGNPDQPILNNLNFRRALYYGIDRSKMAAVIKDEPADFIAPVTYVIDLENKVKYRDTPEAKANTHENFSYDPELAKEYFNRALEEVGTAKVSLRFFYSDEDRYKSMTEFLQSSLAELFGSDRFELKLQAMPYNQVYETVISWPTNPTASDLSWAQWASSDLAPWNAFKYWTSTYPSKNEPYKSEAFDAAFNEANFGTTRFEPGKRLEYTAEMEHLLLDEAIVIPCIQGIDKFMKSDRLELVMKNWSNRVEYGWIWGKIVE